MAVDVADDMPAIRLETRADVFGEPALRFAVDRDAVVVVNAGEFAQSLRAGERAGLVRDAFHQATVAGHHPRAVIDHLVPGAVERAREFAFGEREPDRVRETLAQRAGRGFDAGTLVILGVTGGLRVQLTEMLDVVDRYRVAGQVQHRVEEHRGVAVRQHEAIAIEPGRVVGVVLQHLPPEHFTNVRETHRRTGVAGVRLLHCIHRQRPDRVGSFRSGGHKSRGSERAVIVVASLQQRNFLHPRTP